MKSNYLDFIPQKNSKIKWEENDGKIVVYIKHKGLFDKIAQILFNSPKVTRISLDKYGEFIWKNIDGKNSIYEIANILKYEYGDKIEPLYERLCYFFKLLNGNGLIVLKKIQK